MNQLQPFRVGLTGDFYDAAGHLRYPDIGLDLLESDSRVRVTRFDEHRDEVSPEQLRGLHAAIVLAPRVSGRSLESNPQFLAIGRFGVGFDSVDVKACTGHDVLLFITAGAVDHSVAEATVAWMLALARHLRTKDQLVRAGQWHRRGEFMGCELRDRTLGVVGFGGIGKAVVRMLSGFGMKTPIVFDPFVAPGVVEQAGARPVSLEQLMAQADFVSVHCPLNDQTLNLISTAELALMKPTAYLLNTARGGIVNEDALYEALAARRIAGAALDCFVGEPLSEAPRFAALDNVLLAPHAIAWTDELFRDIGRTASRGMLDLASGRRPKGVVNPEVFDRPGFRNKWEQIVRDLPA